MQKKLFEQLGLHFYIATDLVNALYFTQDVHDLAYLCPQENPEFSAIFLHKEGFWEHVRSLWLYLMALSDAVACSLYLSLCFFFCDHMGSPSL